MPILQHKIELFLFLCIIVLVWALFATGEVYLGNYTHENIVQGSPEWVAWHENKINESFCAGKETLNTIDVCNGYVTTFCMRRISLLYVWTEDHCFSSDTFFKWIWEE